MNEKAKTHNPKADAARAKRQLIRSRSRRRVATSSFALFALVFTVLSLRLSAGLDPSLGNPNPIATTNTPSLTVVSGGEESTSGESEESDDDEGGDDGSVTATQTSTSSPASSPASSQTRTQAPTTRAS